MDEIRLAGLPIRALTREALLRYNGTAFTHVITLNAEIIVQAHEQKRLAAIISNGVATIDGAIPHLCARALHPRTPIEKLAGSDLIYQICEQAASRRDRVFLLGGHPVSNMLSAKRLQTEYGIEVEGFSPPVLPYPLPAQINEDILSRIERVKPAYLFVAFGAPKQEYWIDDHRERLEALGVRVAIGCGGTFDFVSSRIPRAPRWIQRIGMEGLFRLAMEPRWFRVKRLLRSFLFFRYLLNP